MNSEENGRFQTAAQQARRNFEETRRRFDPYGRRAAGMLAALRGWCARNLPGGEKTLWIALSLVLLVLFIWWILPGEEQPGRGGFGGRGGPQPVGVATAAKGDIAVTLNALGTVTPLATVTVRPQVSGQIVRFAIEEGQMVKAGDLLAEIDPRSYRAAQMQAQGQLARDAASLANARLDLMRQQALYAAKATSQQALDTQGALVRQYEGAVMADRASLDAASINLGFARVTSPVAGRVGIRQVDVGNFVGAGQTGGLVVVAQLEPISVLFTVPEDNVGDIVSRMNAGERPVVEVYDRGQTAKIATGRLSAVDTQVDTTTGTVKMRAMFDNANGELFPNQFVNVRLLVSTLRRQVTIPAAAVQRGAEGTFVFVVKADKTVAMRTVMIGVQQDDRVAVVKGLNAGETVVTDGADRLHDGSEVTIPSGQKVAKVAPAQNATEIPKTARSGRRGGTFALFRKLTPEEHTQVCAMSREDRRDWLMSRKDELMKRPDVKGGAPCEGFGGRPPGPPR
jgi:membrane fusion protein, multidrug efflux system